MKFGKSKCTLRDAGYHLVAAILLLIGMVSMPISAQIDGPYSRQVQKMYIAYYGRPGDPAGVDYWASRLEAAGGNWISDLVNAFGDSDEYRSRFGTLTDSTLVDNIFLQMFGRTSDSDGQLFYIDLLNGTNQSGYNPEFLRSSLASIALDIANGASGIDYVTLENKLDFAQYTTNIISTTGAPYSEADISVAVMLTGLVSSDPASVQQVSEAVDAITNGDLPLAMLELFKGVWVFDYQITTNFTSTFSMNGRIENYNGTQHLNGVDQFGVPVNVAWYTDTNWFFLYRQLIDTEEAFIFNFTGPNMISGCYHQNQIWDHCYPLQGTRLTVGLGTSKGAENNLLMNTHSDSDDITAQAIQRRIQNLEESLVREAQESDWLLGSAYVGQFISGEPEVLNAVIDKHRNFSEPVNPLME